ncbi:MAG: HD domain-containing protein [Dehalococcoidia bacterium]|nr:HD domain-containing protein [Dehalococcoidia bacterium]
MPRSVKGDVLYPFATLSLIAVVLVGVAISFLVGHEIETRTKAGASEAVADSTVAVLQPEVDGLDLQTPLSGPAYDGLQQEVSRHVLSGETLHLRIFNREGITVYSSEPSEVGRALADTQAMAAALKEKTVGVTRDGGTSGDGGVSSVGPLLRVYTPLYSSTRHEVAATVEIYRDYSATAATAATAQRYAYLYVGFGLLALYAVLQAGVWGVTRALAKDHARLTYLYQTGEHVRSSLDLQEVLSLIVRDSTLLVQGQYSMVCLVEQESSALAARATYDHDKGSVALHRSEVGDWLFHRVLATGETNVVSTWKADYRRVFGVEIDAPMSIACVPMTLRNKVTGVIAVLRRASGEGFSRAESNMLEELAAQAAMAVEQANLFAKVRAYASELELSYDTTLKALSAALDAKDAATEGHSERVANLTTAIAQEMNVPDEKLVDIQRGALLHDVGKIGVPDAVLRKPRTLSRREWQAMQRHPLLAGILVSKVGFLEGALPILLYHHERFDGGGYPFGLAGDRIPLEARIFAVVDTYDAMTSDRPYRKAVGHAEAVQEIVTHSGSQFDPAAVEAFLRVIEQFPVEAEAETPVSAEEEAA